MKVGLVQFRAARPGPFAKTPRKADLDGLAWLAKRAGEGADLVVLPEMAATGYVFPDRDAVAALAEEPDGPTFQSWSKIAAAQGCWIVGGFPEKDGDRLYNSALVIDPSGARRFVYRKTTLFDADIPWAEPGNSGYHTFETDAGRVGVGICMDLNDDAFVAWARGAELKALAFPTNWVESTPDELHTWVYWAWRMKGLDTALLAANTWGKDGAYTFTGESVILHRDRALAALPPSGNGVVRGTLP